MAVRVKDISASAQRWASRAAGAASDYASEASQAGERWASNTANASQVFFQAVSSAGIQERFRRGVQRSGAAKYTRRIAALGQTRYSQGVNEGQGDWQTGFEPYAQTIAGLTLPQRRPRGDPSNLERVGAVSRALNARRLANLGSTV